ncbi:MAG TPA: dihydrolipoamide acetyltransferase family protein, partial [Acidobacteriota bacterium]|nr:dihydrolipoamide acetyltransferase family protein [Acidobacteriota bacterium]
EIPSPETGVLAEILAEEGETVEVGAVLARIETDREEAEGKPDEAGEERPQRDRKAGRAEESEGAAKQAEGGKRSKDGEAEDGEKSESRPQAFSPVIRKLAKEENLTEAELGAIQGSGRGGRLTKEDVLEYLESRAERPEKQAAEPRERLRIPVPKMAFAYDEERVEIIEMSPMRKRIAEHMVYSKHVSPHTYTVAEVDMTRIVRFRDSVKRQFEKDEGFRLTFTPFILDATAQALKAYPTVNSSVDEDRIIRKEYVNLGVAVAVEDGLLVPVIRDADEKNLLGLARAAFELAEKARTKKLKPEDVQGGTFTVTNPGVFGNVFGLPIINQPQVGILGVGAIVRRPVAIEDDAIAVRSMMHLSLSYDHRVIDGALAARFVQEIRKMLESYDVDHAL